MFSSLRLQTSVVRLLTVIVCLAPVLLLSAPSLLNLNPTTSGEGGALILSADINNGGGGNMTLRVNWGDGPLDVYSYTNTATNFVVWHFYEDDNPTGTAADLYPVSLTLSNNTGL